MNIKAFIINALKVAGVFLSFGLVFRKQMLAAGEDEPQPAENLNLEEPKEQEKQVKKQGFQQNWIPERFARYFGNNKS